MLFIIALLVFLAVTGFAYEVLRARPTTLRHRITPEGAIEVESIERKRTDGSLIERVFAPATRGFGGRIARLLPGNLIRGTARMLVAADEPWSLPGFLAIWVLSAAAGALLWLYIAASSATLTGLQIAVIGMAIMPLAILLPYGRVRSKANRRKRAIVRALPDAMDLLVTTVEAGMGVDAAFAMVTDKTEGPLSETLAQYLKQVGLGRPRREALIEIAERTGVEDLVEIANSIKQGEELGTPVGDVLRVQAEELRARRRERAQTRAQRAPVLMTIPLATCFLPAMVAFVIVPSMLNLVQFVGNLGS